MKIHINYITKEVIFVNPTLEELAENLYKVFPEKEYKDFKIILEWSANS